MYHALEEVHRHADYPSYGEQRKLEMVFDWAAAEGWNPGLRDAKPFLLADPRGFLLAERDGQAVGSISAVAYDSQIFPAPRAAFLEAWISQPGTVALGLLRSGHLAGYGVLRPCRLGRKIVPLLADDAVSAAALLEELLATVPGETVYLDVPEPNQLATNLARLQGMKPVFDTARMYRGAPPAVDLRRTFGVTTLELG